ncbi:hypothetical protein JCM8547_004959 [Rhodosporidiobolus lusitaniae]
MPAAASEFLFDASLIPESVRAVPAGLTLRPLASADYSHGHLALLSHLTSAPDVGAQAWSERFNGMLAVNKVELTYLPFVIVEDVSDQLVGLATVFLEREFLRNAGLVGHLEDAVVAQRLQGKKLGLKLLEVLQALSESFGTSKSILDCDPKLEAFYVKCGYDYKGLQMARYVKL